MNTVHGCDSTRPKLSNQRVLSLTSTPIQSSLPQPAQLVARAQQGDPDAFGELCLLFESRLLRHAMILCGDASVAEDLTQDALVQAWKSLRRYNGRCQFFTWLCAILHNRYRNTRRRKRFLFFFGFEGPRQDEALTILNQQADKAASPDQNAQAHEQAFLVRKCVQALPLKHQQVVYLRFFVDDSLEGIASALGCSVGTVKSRLFHALHKLRAMPDLPEQKPSFNHKVAVL
jgi:RNA polymerase sigma-70 factor (ECF subfamily)